MIKNLSNMLKPNMRQTSYVKMSFNIGARMDLSTGSYVKNKEGHWVMNGGLALTTGFVGPGNSGKTMLADFQMHCAASRICTVSTTSMLTYDTENNTNMDHKLEHSREHESFKDTNIIKDGIWEVTDKKTMYGEKFFKYIKEYLHKKDGLRKKILVTLPFLSIDGKTNQKEASPTFTFIDSVTEFETSDVAEIQDKVELGDKKGLTMFMKQGLAKSRMLMALPTLASRSNNYILTTAHIGKETEIGARPGMAPPKKLHTMRAGDKIKGTTDKFFFLLDNLWQVTYVKPLYNDGSTMTPLYPLDSRDNKKKSVDLSSITVKLLRSKHGASGTILEIITSQKKGVLPALTDFHYIKTSKYYGLSGGNRNYSCDLYPSVSLSRTTVRRLLDTDPLLCRAIEICSEMLQIAELDKYKTPDQLCSPEQLYVELTALNYDWDKILKTRGWVTVNNHEHPIMSLSTLTLLDMRLERIVIPELKRD